jgi:hypothetical protein
MGFSGERVLEEFEIEHRIHGQSWREADHDDLAGGLAATDVKRILNRTYSLIQM